jgi:hypothetical protein
MSVLAALVLGMAVADLCNMDAMTIAICLDQG